MRQPVALGEAGDETRWGGKAAQLARAVVAGLPVPRGFAVSWQVVQRWMDDQEMAAEALSSVLKTLGGPVVVRSSAIDQDAAAASFAGQHATRLNVNGIEAACAAVRVVWASAHAENALAHRRQLGPGGQPRMAIVLQELIDADVAGVLFTRNPVTGADERVIEAAFGLGEAVVAGLVIPDTYRMDRGGQPLETRLGHKAVAVRPAAGEGTQQIAVPAGKSDAASLDEAQLRALDRLATQCEAVFGAGLWLEWAWRGDELHLLQCRKLPLRPQQRD